MPPSSQAYSLPDAHALPAAAVADRLAVDPPAGLESTEAARRAARIGPNELEPPKRTSVWRLVVEAATEPFVLLLLAAGAGAVLLGEVRDGLLVLVGLIPIVGADVVTEYRGERALEALRDASAPMARVRRNGTVSQVTAASLVPGDVVLLSGGDVVPADLRLIRVDRLQLDRSVLTGESIPEQGRTEPDAGDSDLADRRSIAYGGTSVVGGRGEGIVVATGAATELGRIAGGLADRGRRRSPLQAELDRLVRILLWVAIGLIAIVMSLGFIRGQDAGATILAGISAAIAAIPEEPPILLAVVLGLGAYRLLKRGVLVRRLNAEESLGAVDLIITDKTGTLTRNRLDVASVRTPAGPVEDADDRSAILRDALRAEEDAWAIDAGSPPSSFTRSLMRAVAEDGPAARLDPAELLDADPVSDAHPFARTRARRDGRVETLLIGAPEAVLAEAERVTDDEDRVGGPDRGFRGHRGADRRPGPPRGRRPDRDASAHRLRRPAPRRNPRGTGDGPQCRDPDDRRDRRPSGDRGGDRPPGRPGAAEGRRWTHDRVLGRRGARRGAGQPAGRRPIDARGQGTAGPGRPRARPDGRGHRRRRQRRAGPQPRRRRGGDGLRHGRGARGGGPGPRGRFVRDADVRPARGPADRRQRPEGPRLPRLDARRPAGVHPHRDDLRVRPAAAAAPDPVARAVHRPVDVGRLRARAGGAGPDAPPAA